MAQITAVHRNAAGVIDSVQLDPSTIAPVPAASASPIGTIGQRFYVYAPDGRTRVVDPASRFECRPWVHGPSKLHKRPGARPPSPPD